MSNRLRELREASGMTQAEVAHAIGASDAEVIRRWERGMRRPRPPYRNRLAILFGVRVADLGVDHPKGRAE